jgi:addiction module HigA family antidote
MTPRKRQPSHPGEILLKEFLEQMHITQLKLAADLCIPIQRVNTLIRGKRGVSAETALLLGRYFKTGPEFWMNLQTAHDLYKARKELPAAIGRRVAGSRTVFHASLMHDYKLTYSAKKRRGGRKRQQIRGSL